MPFAYTSVFGKHTRIASNALGGTFVPFFNLMRLNRIYTENQMVTEYSSAQNTPDCNLDIAKIAVFSRIFVIFDVNFHPRRHGVLAIRTWTYGNKNVDLFETSPGVLAKQTYFALFLGTNKSNKKKAIPTRTLTI